MFQSILEISYYFRLRVRYCKYFILDIMLYCALYISYINKIQKYVPMYNISHISLIYLIFPKVLKISKVAYSLGLFLQDYPISENDN